MKIFELNVPDGISYLNEWKDGNGQPFNLPCGILDKWIPNCGATTLALEDSHKTIICRDIQLMAMRKGTAKV